MELLEEHDIAHFYIHLPLDYAEFGTCNSLLRELGWNILSNYPGIWMGIVR